MTTKVKQHTSYSIDVDGVECELPYGPDDNSDVLTKVLPNGNRVIGFLCHDQDCPNPCEDCDGVGHIRSLSNRHINHIDRDEAVALLESDPDVEGRIRQRLRACSQIVTSCLTFGRQCSCAADGDAEHHSANREKRNLLCACYPSGYSAFWPTVSTAGAKLQC